MTSSNTPRSGSHIASRGFSFLASPLARPFILALLAVVCVLIDPIAGADHLLWVVALLVIGMPHGAFDIAVVVDQAKSQGRRPATHTAALYTVLTAIAAASFILFPAPTVVAFLLLSAHHFGVSDCVWTRGRAIRTYRDHILGLSHGTAVLTVPFIMYPAAAWQPFVEIAGAAGGSLAIDATLTRWLAALGWLAACTVQVIVLYKRRKAPNALEQGATVLAAVLLGVTAPPLLAVGLYFLIIHALGHCLRADAHRRAADRPGLGNAARVHARSLPLLVPSIAIVAMIAVWAFGGIGLSEVALAFLLFCVIGTLPHHLLWLSAFGPLRRASSAT